MSGTTAELGNPKVVNSIEKATSYMKSGHEFSEAFKKGRWDGRIRLSSLTQDGDKLIHSIPTGLMASVISFLEEEEVSFEILDQRIIPKPPTEPTDELNGFELRSYQKDMVSSLTRTPENGKTLIELNATEKDKLSAHLGIDTHYRIPGIGIWWASTGCHQKGQSITMFGGGLKLVEDIVPGDYLMGMHGQPRRVLKLHRGRDTMVEIRPSSGKSFIVNKGHILSLTSADDSVDTPSPAEILNIPVGTWMKWDDPRKVAFRLYRVECSGLIPKNKRATFDCYPLPEDDYYGFSVDGDNLYLMDDATVTHNSGKTVGAMAIIAKLGVKTLFVVYGNTLVLQTWKRFKEGLGPWMEDNQISLGIATEGQFEPGFITCASVSTLAAIGDRPQKMVTDLNKKLTSFSSIVKKMEIPDEIKKVVQSLIRKYKKKINRPDLADELITLASLVFNAFDVYKDALSPQVMGIINKLASYPHDMRKAIILREHLQNYLNSVELLVYDECHGSAAENHNTLLFNCPSYYKVGLSATPFGRSDGENIKIVGGFGLPVLRVTNQEMKDAGVVPSASIHFAIINKGNIKIRHYQTAYKYGIIYHNFRNSVIISILKDIYERGENVLLIFKNHEHGELLSGILNGNWNEEEFDAMEYLGGSIGKIDHIRVDGRDKNKVREAAIAKFKEREVQILIATDIFGVGLDLPGLDNIVNAAGGKSVIQSLQRLGRGLRGDGHLKLYEFADGHQKSLADHSLERLSIYEGEGCFDIIPFDPIKRFKLNG